MNREANDEKTKNVVKNDENKGYWNKIKEVSERNRNARYNCIYEIVQLFFQPCKIINLPRSLNTSY